jgi:two-component system sensor histidine kinase KdpD
MPAFAAIANQRRPRIPKRDLEIVSGAYPENMRHLRAIVVSVAAVAAGTGLVYAFRPVAPDLSLVVLYVLPVIAVAVAVGATYAVATALASMLAFNFFFLPPLHSFTLTDSENWVALAVYLGTAIVVGKLSADARGRAADAEQREREAMLLAEASLALLRSQHVQEELRGIAGRTAAVLGAPATQIELGSLRRPDPDETAFDLAAGDRHVGRIFFRTGAEPDPSTRARLFPALASILAVAEERERLGYKAVEAETLRRSDAIKTALLRSVSHDFRSPLTAVRAAIDGLLSASLQLQEIDREELLQTIDVEARRLERLVGNLLDLSRLQVGAAEPRPELWTADGIVGRALESLGEGAERVVVTLASENPAFRVDGAQAERVLVNLIENALKFSSPTDPVEVSIQTVEDEVRIRVADRGPGLTKPELEHIFDPFERSGAESGTGLGLAIARGFAEANGGRLWADSKEGGGATFVLAFPLARTTAALQR